MEDEDLSVREVTASALQKMCAREGRVIYEDGQIEHIWDFGLRISD